MLILDESRRLIINLYCVNVSKIEKENKRRRKKKERNIYTLTRLLTNPILFSKEL